MKYCLLTLTLALAACQSPERLASCEGPVFPLNVDRWQPTQSDLHVRDAEALNESP
ncbi:type IV secretion system lipoprotein VirB7 [Bradyrhizobium sp. CCGUVB23]|uniref:type IV secretion system lipoprotein VirB7 n=1 Tax=Bradyrhizobium sp. CCGUVB23 TaxID=2949630 RepID=UPI0020B24530|nr:type IV secretion system lipoprotein VirB7 [Bradyrhizobium sp. CCGUVB23]MCP3468663.1 type IV secretion system lipoprotein VirB7 [Bradyrhizobium sp. CCGUVB23]